MAWFSEKKSTKSLLKTLSSEDKNKRNEAAREFLRLGEEGAESLVSLLGDPDEALCTFVGRILIRLDQKAMPALKKALPDSAFSAQKNIIHILGQMKNEEAFNLLLKALKSENYKLQVLAANSFGESANPQAVPPLSLILSDSDPDVRIAAVKALGNFHVPETYARIADLLEDPEINVRVASAEALGKIKSTSTIPYLIEAMQDSFWWYGRDAIQTLLDVIASFGKSALDPLIELVNAKEPTVRRYAISLLKPLKEPRVIEPLEMAFYDTNHDVAEAALLALVEFGEEVLPIFDEALTSHNDWMREKAVWGIGEIEGEQAMSYLLEILNEPDIILRKAAILALTKRKDSRALPILRAISLKREDKELAKLARQAVIEIEGL